MKEAPKTELVPVTKYMPIQVDKHGQDVPLMKPKLFGTKKAALAWAFEHQSLFKTQYYKAKEIVMIEEREVKPPTAKKKVTKPKVVTEKAPAPAA